MFERCEFGNGIWNLEHGKEGFNKLLKANNNKITFLFIRLLLLICVKFGIGWNIDV
jgi:hypothetical protein